MPKKVARKLRTIKGNKRNVTPVTFVATKKALAIPNEYTTDLLITPWRIKIHK